jgi:hypothetical protein
MENLYDTIVNKNYFVIMILSNPVLCTNIFVQGSNK